VGGLAHLLDRRQEQPDQHRDDRDDDQQLDQCKARARLQYPCPASLASRGGKALMIHGVTLKLRKEENNSDQEDAPSLPMYTSTGWSGEARSRHRDRALPATLPVRVWSVHCTAPGSSPGPGHFFWIPRRGTARRERPGSRVPPPARRPGPCRCSPRKPA